VLLKRVACCILCALPALALNPRRALTQYTRTDWTQEHGLPQDTIRTIAQTKDGYLWLGTDEGLARFDGYDFTVFNKENGALPSNTVSALCASADGSLWIGTPGGLSVYRGGKFVEYTKKEGLPDLYINSIAEDKTGAMWIVAGNYLSRFWNGKFSTYGAREGLAIESMRAVHRGRDGSIYVAGFSGIARRVGERFVPVIDRAALGGEIVSTFTEDRQGSLWVARATGLLMRDPSGKLRLYQTSDGLPDNFVRALVEDRDGNLWAGTNGGLARLDHGRFASSPLPSARERDWVRCLYEDAQGNLWVGMNNGLSRFRDDRFTVYGEAEGLPSDEPNTVYQDRRGKIWVGLHDGGLVELGSGKPRVYTIRDGLPSNEIFSIREDHRGDLLLATRAGASLMHDGHFSNVALADPMHRRIVFDFLESRDGRLWIASPAGLLEWRESGARNATPAGLLLNNAIVVLCEGRDGSLWAGSFGQGLWHIAGGQQRLYTTADGLSNDQIRSIVEDADGTLWIGTFGGGLNALRGGRFYQVTTREGLLSDNIAHVVDDGKGSLWLSTTRGICQVRKSDLNDFIRGVHPSVSPVNYGVADGLRSAQCAPGFPTSRGGTRSSDGRLWFPTSRGLAVLDPNERAPNLATPLVHLLDVEVDGRNVPLESPVELPPGSGRVQFRYTGLELGAPERVVYSYRLESLDRDWVNAGTRRVANYNSLPHGRYRFLVRATIPGAPSAETSFAFELLPHFYETLWFRYFCVIGAAAGMWGLFRLRLRQIRQRFALVLEERARLAREIHDTLAQGFVGISSQLDAVAMSLNGHLDSARQHLNLARKMARHSLTEARRSVMDLRASALEGHDLETALSQSARLWTAGSAVRVQVDVTGKNRKLSEEMEQHLLRIAQEAVTNTVKHAHAQEVKIKLDMENGNLHLQVMDDGQGFEQTDAFSEIGGHFGLMGMRERAQRLGGELQLASKPGEGTTVEVTVPLA